MTDAFEEYAGSGVDYNLGLMHKTRFRSLMSVLLTRTLALAPTLTLTLIPALSPNLIPTLTLLTPTLIPALTHQTPTLTLTPTRSVLFSNVSISNALLDKICDAYPAGDNDPAGGSLKVKWRQFAIDFDEQVPVPWHAGKAPPIRALG